MARSTNIIYISPPFNKGFGAIWDLEGVAGPESQKCPYLGTHANAEYQALSGCPVVPLYTTGSPNDGSYCGHWDETCLRAELMTPFINSGVTDPLSRITVASMEDLGYRVDYSKADAYGRADIGTSCVCNRRALRDGPSGESRPLDRDDPASPPPPRRRHLSAAMRAYATQRGREFMAKRVKPVNVVQSGVPAYEYIGDRVVSVVVQEGDGIFSVMVHRAN